MEDIIKKRVKAAMAAKRTLTTTINGLKEDAPNTVKLWFLEQVIMQLEALRKDLQKETNGTK